MLLSKLNILRNKINKGSLIARLLPFFIVLTSCSSIDINQYGRVVKSSSANQNSFIFSVSEEYLEDNKNSKIDKNNPKMTKAESGLLKKILKKQDYCINEKGDLSFRITSRQEKIYDMTFAHLIEESYNARPVAPRMYYGECVNSHSGMTREEVMKKVQDEVGKLK
jgi:hypothetical protein